MTLIGKAHDTHGVLHLSGSEDGSVVRTRGILSPYFQMADMREKAPDRDTHKILVLMAKKAIVVSLFNYRNGDDYLINPTVNFYEDSTSTNIETWDSADPVLLTQAHTAADITTAITNLILARSTVQGYGISASDISWLIGTPMNSSAMANAPQAAITDAPDDAVTNYNTVTTLLGTLTGAVNDSNTKQNEIAAKLNTLLAELRTLGLIAT